MDWKELNGFVCIMEKEEFGVSGNLRQGLRGRDTMEREERGGFRILEEG